MTRVLHAATAVHRGPGLQRTIAAVFRWNGSDASRVVVRRLRRDDPVPPAYRALLLALWEARRMGARALVAGTPDPDVVAQVTGIEPPPGEAIGPYLQVRALLNAFRHAEVRYLAPGLDRDADAAIGAAKNPGWAGYSDLPLWACAAAS